MSSTSLTPESGGSGTQTPHSQFPKHKITAIARLKSFGESIVSRPKAPPIVFPPPSWDLDDKITGKQPELAPTSSDDAPEVPQGPVEAPEPVTFANKLKGLIEALPIPGTGTSSTSKDEPVTPVPPGMDDGLVRMLSNEDVMNGNHEAGSSTGQKERPGIWNILAGLRKEGKEGASNVNMVEEDDTGLMMYAPLEPKNDSQLQLAKSETVLEYSDADEVVQPEETPVPSKGKGKRKGDKELVEKHIWVPSTTDLSVLTCWWGYRLYLPPAVMEKLGATSVQASARAAMLTTALKWMLDKVPVLLIPPQLRPAMKMLKMLTPYASYVGVFIAWSWERIRSYDKGSGVVLSATWLLPVALVPMSWDAGEIYQPLLAPSEEQKKAWAEAAAKGEAPKKKKYVFW